MVILLFFFFFGGGMGWGARWVATLNKTILKCQVMMGWPLITKNKNKIKKSIQMQEHGKI